VPNMSRSLDRRVAFGLSIRMAESPSLPSTDVVSPPPLMDVVQKAMGSITQRPTEHLGMGLWLLIDMFVLSIVTIPFAILFVVAAQSKNEVLLFGGIALMLLVVIGGALVITSATMGATVLAISDDAESGTGLGFGAVRERLGAGLRLGLPATLLNQVAVFAGTLLCYIPGLIAFAVLVPLMPIMADRKVGAIEAAGICWQHFRARPGWMAGLALVDFLLTFVVSMIPLVGLLLLVPIRMTLGVAAWRAIRALPV
jgi:hypothetical protein